MNLIREALETGKLVIADVLLDFNFHLKTQFISN